MSVLFLQYSFLMLMFPFFTREFFAFSFATTSLNSTFSSFTLKKSFTTNISRVIPLFFELTKDIFFPIYFLPTYEFIKPAKRSQLCPSQPDIYFLINVSYFSVNFVFSESCKNSSNCS